MIKVGVLGALGRMGREACATVDDAPDTELFAQVDQGNSLDALMRVLETGNLAACTTCARALTAEICRGLATPPVNVEIRGVRPRNTRGELHGLFYPYDARIRRQPYIVLWMRTAQRHDVVKPRTFLRTLMHELGHYLDYALLKLEDSYHSGGFYQRESFLVRTLCPAVAPPPRTRK